MLDKISRWLNLILIVLIIIGVIYYKRALNIAEEEKKALVEKVLEKEKAKIKPLEELANIHADSLRVLKDENSAIKKEMVRLKIIIGNYEEIRYYDDIDFDRASSIITNSHYRHTR